MLTDDLLQISNIEASQRPGLGRLFAFDPKDKGYPMAVRRVAGRVKHYNLRHILDQGSTSQCVAYAWTGALKCGPVKNTKNLPAPKIIYDWCQANDEWDGSETEAPHYEGTSVRAGAKWAQENGYLSHYVWADDAHVVAAYIINRGPVVFGTDWYEGMMQVHPKNEFVRATGGVYGGHAYLALGCNLDLKCPDGTVGAIRIQNSWGEDWGVKGRAWISIADADRLIKSWGEACAAAEIKK